MRAKLPCLVLCILMFAAGSCQDGVSEISPVAGNMVAAAPSRTVTHTAVPHPTNTLEPDTATPTSTMTPSDTPTLTNTPLPTETQLPFLSILVVDEEDDRPISKSVVQLVDAGSAFFAQQSVGTNGQVLFTGLTAGIRYTLTANADGYQDSILSFEFDLGMEPLIVAMEPGIAPTATSVPPPTRAVAAPPPPSSALGNLLTNPSFEAGDAGWHNAPLRGYTAHDNAQFVHSGTRAVVIVREARGRPYYYQHISNVVPGQTYRAGVWVKVWSSDGEDRTRSENPGDYAARLCINPQNESDPNRETSICTGFVRPLDTWQYLSIDGVAGTDTIAVILQGAPIGPNLPLHNEAIWDDVSVVLSSVAATPTPPPLGPPVRPAPVPFAATALRENMQQTEWVLNQMGGLLDRLFRGSWESCEEYEGYYRQLMGSPTYHSLPDAWHGVYNEYVFAVENAANLNNGVFSLCEAGGGYLNDHAYGDARSSIANSLERLIPAVQRANALPDG